MKKIVYHRENKTKQIIENTEALKDKVYIFLFISVAVVFHHSLPVHPYSFVDATIVLNIFPPPSCSTSSITLHPSLP